MRTIPRMVVAVVALMLMAPAAAADQGKGSGDGRPAAVPAVNVSGSTGGELVGDWYAQNLSLPADTSPFGGTANLCLNLNAVDLTIPGLICPVSLGCLLGRSPKR